MVIHHHATFIRPRTLLHVVQHLVLVDDVRVHGFVVRLAQFSAFAIWLAYCVIPAAAATRSASPDLPVPGVPVMSTLGRVRRDSLGRPSSRPSWRARSSFGARSGGGGCSSPLAPKFSLADESRLALRQPSSFPFESLRSRHSDAHRGAVAHPGSHRPPRPRPVRPVDGRRSSGSARSPRGPARDPLGNRHLFGRHRLGACREPACHENDGVPDPVPQPLLRGGGLRCEPPLGARAVTDETRLLLYALYQQATAGAARPSRGAGTPSRAPNGAAGRSSATSPPLDAMRMYVSTLEEENPDWFSLLTDSGDPARVAEALEAAARRSPRQSRVRSRRLASERAASRRAPPPRGGCGGALAPRGGPHRRGGGHVDRAHGADRRRAEAERPVRARHGRRGGRRVRDWRETRGARLGDVFALHLPNLTWRRVDATVAAENGGDGVGAFPARSGHAAVTWGTKVVVIGGYQDDKDSVGVNRESSIELDAWTLDTETSEWARLDLRGPAPPARGGHTATLVRGEAGAKIVVFGGVDAARAPAGRAPSSTWPPEAGSRRARGRRAGGGARGGTSRRALAAGRARVTDVYVFGGVCAGSAGEVSGALFALDTMSMAWRELEPRACRRCGAPARRRAVVGEAWFVAGGGGGGRRAPRHRSAARGALLRRARGTSAAEVGAGSSLAAEGAGVVAVGAAPRCSPSAATTAPGTPPTRMR